MDNWVTDFSNGKDVNTPENLGSYSYDDILGINFKLINSSECYEYDEEYKIWRDKTDNTEYMKNVVENGDDLTIVGIVQPKENATSTMLNPGICYPASLTKNIIETAGNSTIVQEQLANPEIDVFTGKRFDDTGDESSFDMNSLIEVDTNAIQSAFKIDQSKIKVDFGNLNNVLSQNSLPTFDINDILNNIEFSMSSQDIQKLMKDLLKGYDQYVEDNELVSTDDLNKYLMEYLESDEAKAIITNNLSQIIQSQDLETQISVIMENYMQDIMSSMSKSLQKEMQSSITSLSKSIAGAISIDENAFIGAFQLK